MQKSNLGNLTNSTITKNTMQNQTTQHNPAIVLSQQEQSNSLQLKRKAILTSKAFSKWNKYIAQELERIQLEKLQIAKIKLTKLHLDQFKK